MYRGRLIYTPAISLRHGTNSTWSHGDIKNSLTQTAENETTSATKHYDAFGNDTTSTGTWQGPFQYGGNFGYQTDPDSNLKLLGHRYYDPSTGRFLTRDPIKDGRNWYAYGSNNPIKNVDPFGLWTAPLVLALLIPPKERVLLVVYGDRSRQNGILPLWFWQNAISEPTLNGLRPSFDRVKYLHDPSLAQLQQALDDASAFYFFGHGAEGVIMLNYDEGATAGDVKQALGTRKLEFVWLETCGGLHPDWLSVAPLVIGIEGDLHAQKRAVGLQDVQVLQNSRN